MLFILRGCGQGLSLFKPVCLLEAEWDVFGRGGSVILVSATSTYPARIVS